MTVRDSSPRAASLGDRTGPPPLAYAVAALIGVFALLFRFLALRSLTDDHYLYLSAAQQILLGEIPGRDFVEPGMLLQFLLSAAGQAVAPGPATEGILTAAILAIAAAATAIAVSWVTRSVAAGALAALLQVLMQPRLYSFPKIIVPAVLVVLVLTYARRPRASALFALAAWIIVAFLLRHDVGVYAALGGTAGVALSHRTLAAGVRAGGTLAATVLLLLLPYFAFLSWGGGVVEHVRGAFEYGKAEWVQLRFPWPTFTFGAAESGAALPWSDTDSAAFFFYAAYALPFVVVLLLAQARYRDDVVVRSGLGAATALMVPYVAIILRHPLVTRVQDLAALYAVLGAWTAVALLRATGATAGPLLFARYLLTRTGLAAILAVALVSIDTLGGLREELRVTELTNSAAAVRARARAVITSGREWPWTKFWPAGDLPPAIDYLDACLGPADRVWLTWRAPEYYVFARRGFGAGHPMTMAPRSYTTPQDQELMIKRLEQHHVPVVLINEKRRPDFAGSYSRVDSYLRDRYVVAGQFTIRGDETISIAVRRGTKATTAYGEQRWPCRMVPDGAIEGASPSVSTWRSRRP